MNFFTSRAEPLPHCISQRYYYYNTSPRFVASVSQNLSCYNIKKSHLFFSNPEIGCAAWVCHFFDAFRVSTICKSRAFSSLCIKPIVIFHTYLRLTIVNIYDIIYDRRIENVTIYSSFSHMTHRESQGASSSDKGNQSFFYSYKTDQNSFLAHF